MTAYHTSEGVRFLYCFSFRDGRERHDWSLIGKAGAIDVWAQPNNDRSWGERWFGGVEIHFAAQPDYLGCGSRHDNCWFLQKPCWHDGSSLYFSERVEPRLPEPTGAPIGGKGIHQFVAFICRDWFDDKLAEAQASGEVA